MKEFKRDSAEWIEGLPTWQKGVLFPNSKSVYREDIEAGWMPVAVRDKETGELLNPLPLEASFFNLTMSANCAPFADIIGQYTGHLYRSERTRAIFAILAKAWSSYVANPWMFGTRQWMHLVCQEVMS